MSEDSFQRDEKRWKTILRLSLAGTGAWIVAGVAVAIFSKTPIWHLTLSGGGDFFAGFAGPPAFYWLVLGFFQQGRELRIQADELRHSVEQFRIQSRHMGEDLKHATMLERKNQVRRQFDLRQKQLSFVLEPLYRNKFLGPQGATGTVWMFDTVPLYVSRPDTNDLKAAVELELARLASIENGRPDIWTKLFAEHAADLKDFPLRAANFAYYVAGLKAEASSCNLHDIVFELRRDRIKDLGNFLLRVAHSSGAVGLPSIIGDHLIGEEEE